MNPENPHTVYPAPSEVKNFEPQKNSSLAKLKEMKGSEAEFSGKQVNDLTDVQEVGDGGDMTDSSPRADSQETADLEIRGRKRTPSKLSLI